MLTDNEIDDRLAQIEAEIPRLRRNMNTFPREFEDRADRLCGEVSDDQQDYVLDRLRAMVQRAGING
ncbi:MAG TPA: hypothetical protein DD456_13500 [Stenotrophomonas sp.]|nr:hypothetical protein [Stenotrophomonas sp.]